MGFRGWPLLLAATLLSSCQEQAARKEVGRSEAIGIADAYVAKAFPPVSLELARPIAYDRQRTWLLIYQIPEDAHGLMPVVAVDKRNGRVVLALCWQ
jgi:hypothetical protein